ncbi:phosphotransferase enzyme family protein [Paenibacillus pedocola]|uniref:phosphotransferase enzyme family protein n=1 Tax=Paenibacillus pedocola TaxID=3242193 RepID=UPI0028772602|nr:phosphotransferase [Paenibacillus typhae]
MFTESDYVIIAQEALKKYDLGITELVYLGKSDSVTFRVNSSHENSGYLLKLHYSDSANRTKDVIESELHWLEALSNDTDLIVPAPVRNGDHELITVISYGTEESLNVTCYRWVDGEVLDREPTVQEVSKLALLMSALHQHSMQWEIPEGFVRPVYHVESLMSSLAQLHKQISSGLLTDEQFTLLESTARRITEVIGQQPLTPEHWGIIHSDLHESNYVFHHQDPRPIDFSACGYGFYLFDIAETFLHLLPDNRKAFISAYKQHHQLPADYVNLLESYFIWAILRNFAFLSVNPLEHEDLSRTIPYVIGHYCQKYLNGEPFLLN